MSPLKAEGTRTRLMRLERLALSYLIGWQSAGSVVGGAAQRPAAQ
jgi:hypothetical protein